MKNNKLAFNPQFNDKTYEYLVNKYGQLTVENVKEFTEDIVGRVFNQKNLFSPQQSLSFQYSNFFSDRIRFYNEVTRNTLKKFPPVPDVDDMILPVNTYFDGVYRYEKGSTSPKKYEFPLPDGFVIKRTDVLSFITQPKPGTRTQVNLSAKLFWNDPVAIAQHARQVVRTAQKDNIKRQVVEAKNRVITSKNSLTRKNQELEKAEKLLASLEQEQQRLQFGKKKKKTPKPVTV